MLIATDWFDGTREELNLPDGWARATVRDTPMFVHQAQRRELFFGVRKALPETREEDTRRACQTIALHDALSLKFWPGLIGARLLLSVSRFFLQRPRLKSVVTTVWM